MKRILLAICSCFIYLTLGAHELKVATFNIRYDNPQDYKKGNGWGQRKDKVIDFLKAQHLDIFGAQEVLAGQLSDLASALPKYGYVGVGRDDGKSEGEHCPIFYRKDRFTLKSQETIWLSETPGQVSYGWDAACRRICSYAVLEDKESGRTICFFNLHLDHVGVKARRESVKLVLKKVWPFYVEGSQIVITGDFNVDQNSEPYARMVGRRDFQDCYRLAESRFAPCGTFNDWKPEKCSKSRIDHIFVSEFTKVLTYSVETYCYWDKKKCHTLSDHFPVIATIAL